MRKTAVREGSIRWAIRHPRKALHKLSPSWATRLPNEKSNRLGHVRFWGSERIPLSPIETRNPARSCLLVRRRDPLTEAEQLIYDQISQEETFTPFGRGHLGVIFLSEEPLPVQSNHADPRRIIDRIPGKDRPTLARFRFIIAINPTTRFAAALRACSDASRAIYVFTEDFGDAIGRELARVNGDADAVIVPERWLEHEALRLVRRSEGYKEAACYPAVMGLVHDMQPKDHNMFMQVLGDPKYRPDLLDHDRSWTNAILRLCIDPSRAPVVGRSFNAYVSSLIPYVEDLYLTEETFQRYRSLVLKLDNPEALKTFLLVALADGCRVKVEYDEASPSLS